MCDDLFKIYVMKYISMIAIKSDKLMIIDHDDNNINISSNNDDKSHYDNVNYGDGINRRGNEKWWWGKIIVISFLLSSLLILPGMIIIYCFPG